METFNVPFPRRNIALASVALLLSALNASNVHAGIITAGDTGVFPTLPTPTFIVGNTIPGVNTLTVNGGSVLNSAAGFGLYSSMLIGNAAGVSGSATVTGAGSQIVTTGLPTSPGLWVGANGSGTLNVLAGGSATVNRFDTNVFIPPGPPPAPPASSTGTSSVKVDGVGSKITSASTFNIGVTGSGPGTLTATAEITGGGVVNAQTSVVGSLRNSDAKLTVSGAGSALNLVTGATNAFGRAFLTIGREQKGEVDILAGGKVTINGDPFGIPAQSAGVVLGGSGGGTPSTGASFANGDGTLKIDGAGSELRIKQTNPFAAVALQGKGSLAITNGGALIVEDATFGAMFVGRNVGGNGTVTVTDANSVLQAGRRLLIGTDANAITLLPGGTGVVDVANGGTIRATRTIVGSKGTLTGGGGTVVGELVNGGTLAPGNSPGIMNVLGNVTLQSAGKVLLELGGTNIALSQYDQLNARDDPNTTPIEGLLSVDGLVSVSLYGGFNPFAGSFFDVFTALDITEIAPTYALPTLSPGLHWEHSIVSLAGVGEALRLSVVPEPGSFALLGIGLIGLLATSRRMRPVTRVV